MVIFVSTVRWLLVMFLRVEIRIGFIESRGQSGVYLRVLLHFHLGVLQVSLAILEVYLSTNCSSLIFFTYAPFLIPFEIVVFQTLIGDSCAFFVLVFQEIAVHSLLLLVMEYFSGHITPFCWVRLLLLFFYL